LLIEAYFQDIQTTISTCIAVASFSLDCEKRDTYEGFIRGEIRFIDSSILNIREFVSVETDLERDMYAYQYMDAQNTLIFRYDNTQHHKKLNLPTYPHHKHDKSETNVIASSAPMLIEVLQEILDQMPNSNV
jgi:Family of unknown function (DUF6516)